MPYNHFRHLFDSRAGYAGRQVAKYDSERLKAGHWDGVFMDNFQLNPFQGHGGAFRATDPIFNEDAHRLSLAGFIAAFKNKWAGLTTHPLIAVPVGGGSPTPIPVPKPFMIANCRSMNRWIENGTEGTQAVSISKSFSWFQTLNIDGIMLEDIDLKNANEHQYIMEFACNWLGIGKIIIWATSKTTPSKVWFDLLEDFPDSANLYEMRV